MSTDAIIGRRPFVDGVERDVYQDGEGQYVLDGGMKVYGVWVRASCRSTRSANTRPAPATAPRFPARTPATSVARPRGGWSAPPGRGRRPGREGREGLRAPAGPRSPRRGWCSTTAAPASPPRRGATPRPVAPSAPGWPP